jgi:hypothetical protein
MTHFLVVLFDVFVFLGVVPLACILAVAIFSKTIQRSVGWYNLMVAWLVMGSSYGLLLGRQEDTDDPPPSLCLIQALLIYASPVLYAFIQTPAARSLNDFRGNIATLTYYTEVRALFCFRDFRNSSSLVF